MLKNYDHNYTKGMKCFFMILFLLLAGPTLAPGQLKDNIYMVNETSIGNVEIVGVSKRKVEVQNQQGKKLDFKAKEILMVFNEDGRFLTFPNEPQQVQHFFSKGEEDAEIDLIVTLSGQLIPGHIRGEEGAEINYDDLATEEFNKKLSTTEIATIIYKEGNHKLFASPSQVSGILVQLGEQVSEARLASYKSAENPALNVFSSAYSGSEKVVEPAEPKVKAVSVDEESPMTSPEIDAEVYSRKALQKTTDLGTYLAIVSDRKNSLGEANKAVDLAVKLFIDENAQFEVSSREGRERYKVRAYLNRLKLLKYDKIEISWSDISYVSDLKKGIDGNYYGVITLQQRFKGFMDNRVVYSDLTEKNVEVKVMAYQKETDGAQHQMWDVFLSDVGVVVTKFDQ